MKNVEDKIYGIDLDGVSVDFIGDFSSFIKSELGIWYDDSEITNYYWHKCDLGISETAFWTIFHNYGMHHGRYEHLVPLPGAVDGIKFLLDNAKDVWFITGRPHYAYEQTVRSLSKHFDVASDRIIFSSGDDYKSNVVRRLGIDTFFDDAPHYAESLAENTDAQVYLMDTTYNREVSNPKINRVKSWSEFIEAQ